MFIFIVVYLSNIAFPTPLSINVENIFFSIINLFSNNILSFINKINNNQTIKCVKINNDKLEGRRI